MFGSRKSSIRLRSRTRVSHKRSVFEAAIFAGLIGPVGNLEYQLASVYGFRSRVFLAAAATFFRSPGMSGVEVVQPNAVKRVDACFGLLHA